MLTGVIDSGSTPVDKYCDELSVVGEVFLQQQNPHSNNRLHIEDRSRNKS